MVRGWKYAAASVIGTSHLKSDTGVCQDSHACTYAQTSDRLICVVSDGAGSASLSERGSRLTCDLVAARIIEANNESVHTKEFALEVLEAIRSVLESEASPTHVSLREFACTLLVAIVEEQHATFWQIGDGAICFRLHGEEPFRYAFWPDKGEYANTTYFVTDLKATEELEFDSSSLALTDLAVFSDGLERLALDFKLGEVHTNFFTGFFPFLYKEPPGHLVELEQQLAAFLGSDRVNKHTDDDKTLVLATLENR
jgi:hypothetical protein